MRRIRALVLVIAVMGVPAGARAADSPTPAAVAACHDAIGSVPELGGRSCRSLEQLGRSTAQVCRAAGVGDEDCRTLDGRSVTTAAIDDFESSWTARALALQRQLGAAVPLRLGLMAHTHNSFNSAAYFPTLSRLDHNQVHTLFDQLRMGVRAIEIDVHWAPNVTTLSNAPTTCHAEPVATPVVVVHAGCTLEGTLRDALGEVDAWLRANPGEVILLYLENNLDGDPQAHDTAVADIESTVGDLVYRPSSSCADLPVDVSVADIRAAGKQVIITGNCGPGAWGSWVHPRGDAWSESSSGEGDDYPAAPQCGDRVGRDYDSRIIRFWGDSTWLSYMASGHGSEVTAAEVRDMVACGVNLVGFDQLVPDDGRLDALVWSWAPSEPATAAGCAARGADGWFADDCEAHRAFACATETGWVVTETTGEWAAGATACSASAATFAVPHTGRDDALLGAVSDADDVWLAYRHTGSGWVATTS